jgi:hypothetical protein
VTASARLLQAASLPFIVTATTIGVDIGGNGVCLHRHRRRLGRRVPRSVSMLRINAVTSRVAGRSVFVP